MRVVHISANQQLGAGTGHSETGCDRAVNIVRNKFLHSGGTCLSNGPTRDCTLAGLFCTHRSSFHEAPFPGAPGYRHHWHHCSSGGEGPHAPYLRIDWHYQN